MSDESNYNTQEDSDRLSEKIPTRRQTLKAIGSTTIVGTWASGIVAGRQQESTSAAVKEYAPDWWENKDIGAGQDLELIAEGTDQWVSEDSEAPDWFTIGDDDEFRYKPHGVFRSTGAELCLPTSVDVSGMTVGLEACHYGGCKWKLEACVGACVGTGMKDSCDGYFSLGVDLGVVSGTLEMFPDGKSLSPYSTAMVLEELEVNGELCYYYILGSDCKNVNVSFEFL